MATRLGKLGYGQKILLLCALLLSGTAHAQRYPWFGPANGILVGSTTTYQTTAAAWSNIQALLTGTCDSSHVVNGAGACVTPAAGTVTSVGLTAPSWFTVSGSPVTSSGVLAITANTESANTLLAGPSSGSAAAPVFRSLVNADFPTSGVTAGTYPNANVTVNAQGIVTGASAGGCPAGSSGQIQFFSSAGVCGASSAFTINPSTGEVTIAAPSSGNRAFQANGVASQFAGAFVGASGAGTSDGLLIQAGTNSSDQSLYIANQAGSISLFAVQGDGGAVVGSPTGGDKGVGTLNAAGLFVNGVAVSTGGSPGGSNTDMQYNCSGVFCGASNVTYNSTSGLFTVAAPLTGNLGMTVSGGASCGGGSPCMNVTGTTNAVFNVGPAAAPGDFSQITLKGFSTASTGFCTADSGNVCETSIPGGTLDIFNNDASSNGVEFTLCTGDFTGCFLYINEQPIAGSGTAFAMMNGSSGGCSVNTGFDHSNVASCSRSSTGVYRITLTNGGTGGGNPACVASLFDSIGGGAAVFNAGSQYNLITVEVYNSGGTLVDDPFTFRCD